MRAERGFTIAELLAVVAILSILAVVAVPSLSPSIDHEVERGAHEVADAIRFARTEAMRTGSAHAVLINPTDSSVRLFRPDFSSTPATPIFDVLHPLSKQPYDLSFSEHPVLPPMQLAGTVSFWSTCDTSAVILFPATGEPRCINPMTAPFESAVLTLSVGSIQHDVSLEGITGRVTVQ